MLLTGQVTIGGVLTDLLKFQREVCFSSHYVMKEKMGRWMLITAQGWHRGITESDCDGGDHSCFLL